MKYILLIISLLFASNLRVFAQRKLTIEDCDSLFVKNNLQLLIEHYNIDIKNAAVLQAKIWDLPYFSSEVNAINPTAKKYFDINKNGEKSANVQQLIYLGNKRKNQINFEKSNVEIAQLQYEQTLLNLKKELGISFYNLYFNQYKTQNISNTLNNLDSLIDAYQIQVTKGNLPLKDLVRLQTLALGLKNEILDIQQENLEYQKTLKILTGISDEIYVESSNTEVNRRISKQLSTNTSEYFERAKENNPSYLTATSSIENSKLYLKWQQSLKTPDVTLGSSYDQNGGAFKNQVNMTLGVPLPIWNRNKGNIKAANLLLSQSSIQLEQVSNELKQEILYMYKSFVMYQNQYLQMISSYSNIDEVYQGMLLNFHKRNISLIEFADFMESYNHSMIFLSETKKQIFFYGYNLNSLINNSIF